MPNSEGYRKRKDITKLKKSSSQALAISDRRRLVHLRLQQHFTIRQIAEQLDVTTNTVLADKKAIAKSLSKEHVDMKAIDLDDLDSMEKDCIDQVQGRLAQVGALIEDVEEMGAQGPKILKVMYDNAADWWDKRLRLKQLRGKWLGYEAKLSDTVQTKIEDNSIKVFVQAPGREGPMSFAEYAKGIFSVEEGAIEGKQRELPAPELNE